MDRPGENHPEGAEYRNRRGPLNYLESELLRAGGKGGDREECVFSAFLKESEIPPEILQPGRSSRRGRRSRGSPPHYLLHVFPGQRTRSGQLWGSVDRRIARNVLHRRICQLYILPRSGNSVFRFDYGPQLYPLMNLLKWRFDAWQEETGYDVGIEWEQSPPTVGSGALQLGLDVQKWIGRFQATVIGGDSDLRAFLLFLKEELCCWYIRFVPENEFNLGTLSYLHPQLAYYNTLVNDRYPPHYMDTRGGVDFQNKLKELAVMCIAVSIQQQWKKFPLAGLNSTNKAYDYVSMSTEEEWKACRLWTVSQAVWEMKRFMLRGRRFVGSIPNFVYYESVDFYGTDVEEEEREATFWDVHHDAFSTDANPMGMWPPRMTKAFTNLRLGMLHGRRRAEDYRDTWTYVPVRLGLVDESARQKWETWEHIQNAQADDTQRQSLRVEADKISNHYQACSPMTADELCKRIKGEQESDDGQDVEWSWQPIHGERDLVTNRNRAEFSSAKRNEIWTMLGTMAHERLFVRSAMRDWGEEEAAPAEDPDDAEWMNLARHSEFLLPTDFSLAADSDASRAQAGTPEHDKIFPGDSEFVKQSETDHLRYAMTLHHFYSLYPELNSIRTQGPGGALKDIRQYAWAFPHKQAMDALADAFADNCWYSLPKALNQVELKREHFGCPENVDIKLSYIAAEFPVVWPFGLNRTGKGYETRIDAVVHLEDVVNNSSTGYVAIVEYKMRMELEAPAESPSSPHIAASNFSRVLVENSRDKLQAESNAWLFYLNTGILPTFAIVVNSTRRQLPLCAPDSVGARRRYHSADWTGSETTDGDSVPCCYVAIKRLDFRRFYLLSMLDRFYWRPFGGTSAGKTGYVDSEYIVPDIQKLAAGFDSNVWKVDPWVVPHEAPDEHLQKLLCLLPRSLLTRAVMRACAVSYRHEHELAKRRRSARPRFRDNGYKLAIWNNNGGIREHTPTFFCLHCTGDHSDRGNINYNYYRKVAVMADGAYYAFRTSDTLSKDVASQLIMLLSLSWKQGMGETGGSMSLMLHTDVPESRSAALNQRHTVCLPTMFYLGDIDDPRMHHAYDRALVRASALHSGTAVVQRLFRENELSTVINATSRQYPKEEPAQCRRMRKYLNDLISGQVSAFIRDIYQTPDITLSTLKQMSHVDFFVHSIVSIFYRATNQDILAEREFHGWDGLINGIRRQVQASGLWRRPLASWTNSGEIPQAYTQLHPLGDHDDSDDLQALQAERQHKTVSLIRCVNRLLNQRLFRGLCEMYGETPHNVLTTFEGNTLQVPEQALEYLSHDGIDYDPLSFPHLSQRACWSTQALQAVCLALDSDTKDKTMVEVAMQHIRDDLCFVATTLHARNLAAVGGNPPIMEMRITRRMARQRHQQQAVEEEDEEWTRTRRQLLEETIA